MSGRDIDDLISRISGINLHELLYTDYRPMKCICAAVNIPNNTFLGYIEGNICDVALTEYHEGYLIVDDNYIIEAFGNILAYIREGSLHGLVRNCMLMVEGGPGTERIGMKTIADIPQGAELSYYAGAIDI